jgi:HPt (histidine-containing phosphotransfer) domain-containing protein
MTGQIDKCAAAGMDDFLTKPLDVAHLRTVLDRYIGAQHSTSSAPPTDAPPQDTPEAEQMPATAIDLAKLAQVTDGDVDFAQELTEAYMASGRQVVNDMREGLVSMDRDRLRKSAHQLKGASANIHAEHLYNLCAALESAAREDDQVALAAMVQKISVEMARSSVELQVYLASVRSAA